MMNIEAFPLSLISKISKKNESKMSKEWAIVWGATGALGRDVVERFKEGGLSVISVDLAPSPTADVSVVIKSDGTKEDAQLALDAAKKVEGGISVVVCVAGGFDMGPFKEDRIFEQLERMYSVNVRSSFAAGWVAANSLKENGLLVFTGSAGTFNQATPFLSAYGAAKASTHHLTTSLAASKGDFKSGVSVVCMLPVMLDTPMNRKSMPSENFANWTPCGHIANLLLDWNQGKNRPANGSFVKIQTKDGETSTTLEH
eukprot:TRINITY_DN722_c0_g1_i3.p1 TRINITY_DN722_c0_g1~~TRINITY_DN722_c0_g1_i3.p1  ORF type:complete len:257 (+),score=78.73 TRINITY_DN722_c0_g1_i3:393-1163(+)